MIDDGWPQLPGLCRMIVLLAAHGVHYFVFTILEPVARWDE